jgi:hypothetical protein
VFEDADNDAAFDEGENPLPGVAVSDGVDVAITDEQGLYRLQTDGRRIVFVSVPGSHHAPDNKFYRDPEGRGGEQTLHFPLVRNAETTDREKFMFVFVTDTHTADYRYAREGTEKAYKAIAALEPDLVIHGGDIVFDLLHVSREALARQQFDLYVDELAPLIEAPLYHTIGNHDILGWSVAPAPESESPLYGKKIYRKYFGPTHYSFNYNQCHFIILDSIGRTMNDAGGGTYYGSLDQEQLEWVQKDLAVVGTAKPVILVSHIPMINALASLFGVTSEAVHAPDGTRVPKHQTRGFQQLLGEVLDGYNFRLALAGHYHTYEEIHWIDNTHDAYFVVGGSVCGEWWKGDRTVGYSRWAEGFTRVEVDGDEFAFSYVPFGWLGVEEQLPAASEATEE